MPSSRSLSRRRFLAALPAAGAVGVAGCTAQSGDDEAARAAGENADWPTDAHDAANTGYNPEASGPRDGAAIRWQVPASATAPPVVADGRVYLATSEQFLCLSADDGGELWQFRDGDFWGPPTVVDDLVYVPDAGRTLRALDAETGEPEWTADLDGGVTVAPTPGHEAEELYLGDREGTVYRIDAASGEIDWQSELFGEIQAPVAYSGTGPTLHVATFGGEVYELSQHDGDGVWRQKLPGIITTAPAVVGGTIYVGASGRLFALDDNRAGGIRWRSEDRTVAHRHLTVADGTVFSSGLAAVDAESGETQWEADGDFYCSPTVAGDTVYIGDEQGVVHAYDVGGGTRLGPLQFGEKRWSLHLGEGQRVREGLVVADDMAFAVTLPPSNEYEPTLFALEPA